MANRPCDEREKQKTKTCYGLCDLYRNWLTEQPKSILEKRFVIPAKERQRIGIFCDRNKL